MTRKLRLRRTQKSGAATQETVLLRRKTPTQVYLADVTLAGSFFLIDLIVAMPDPKLTFHHRTAQKTRKMTTRGDFSASSCGEDDADSGNEIGGQPAEESSAKRRRHRSRGHGSGKLQLGSSTRCPRMMEVDRFACGCWQRGLVASRKSTVFA